jgi:ectoine hydroxylase-related dioxygenase (phytanoyl-CoA dioxygenase family)
LFPLGPGMKRHDSRLRMPVHWASIFIPLVDIPELEFGPTQYVPGSHYAGTHPNDLKEPQFETNRPVSMFTRVGDIYLHNHQCWHRAAPNTSGQTRYLFQNTYGARWVGHWFYPYVNYKIPSELLERATERRRRLLGIYSTGPFS